MKIIFNKKFKNIEYEMYITTRCALDRTRNCSRRVKMERLPGTVNIFRIHAPHRTVRGYFLREYPAGYYESARLCTPRRLS